MRGKSSLTLFLFLFSFICFGKNFSVIHYNIKELDTKKMREGNPQVLLALDLIKKYPFELLSLNEIQYDLPGIPYASFTTKGKNIRFVGDTLEEGKNKEYFSLFHPGNTGHNAKKKRDGLYWPNLKNPKARAFADPVNFGLFPGQYGIGGLFKFPLKKKTVLHQLKWKDFEPGVDLSTFRDALGHSLPQDMALFDKAFVHAVLDVDGEDLHMILLHTVPAFSFGNSRSINIKRNAAQLRFLEWFLTGKTFGQEVSLKGIRPLSSGDPFIAMGDFNVDFRDSQKEGAKVMRSLLEKVSLVGPMTHTYEAPGFQKRPRAMLLDYILYGGDHLQLKKFLIHGALSGRQELGCPKDKKDIPKKREGKVLLKRKKGRKTCYFYVNKDYFEAKQASDHFLLWANFSLENPRS